MAQGCSGLASGGGIFLFSRGLGKWCFAFLLGSQFVFKAEFILVMYAVEVAKKHGWAHWFHCLDFIKKMNFRIS